MTDDSTEIETPDLIDIGKELATTIENIDGMFKNYIGLPPREIDMLARSLVRLWRIVEQEVRRIDNEVTEGLVGLKDRIERLEREIARNG